MRFTRGFAGAFKLGALGEEKKSDHNRWPRAEHSGPPPF